jgi:hypothetical protein
MQLLGMLQDLLNLQLTIAIERRTRARNDLRRHNAYDLV